MTHTTRRGVLRAGAALAAGSAALGTPRRAAAQETFGGWMEGVGNYDGVVDATGRSEVTVTVGAQANGGAFGFDPAAVRVDPGTTVVWEWTGKGAQHNVVAEEGADFESELTSKAGHTFSRTFDAEGTVTYACTPHRSLGMKGVVVVGGDAGSTDGGAAGTSDSGSSGGTTGGESGTAAAADGDGASGGRSGDSTAASGGDGTVATLVGGGIVGAALSPLLFGVFLKLVDEGSAER